MEHRVSGWQRAAALSVALGAAAAAALGACGGPTAADAPRVVGVIGVDRGPPPAPALPDTVRAGVAFTVQVTTYGSGSCTRPDGATVQVAGLAAEVTPYDRDPVQAACTRDLRAYPRPAAVRFDAAGPAVVRVRGRASATSDSTLTVEARVVVVR